MRLSLGIYERITKQDAVRLVDNAVDVGATFIDTPMPTVAATAKGCLQRPLRVSVRRPPRRQSSATSGPARGGASKRAAGLYLFVDACPNMLLEQSMKASHVHMEIPQLVQTKPTTCVRSCPLRKPRCTNQLSNGHHRNQKTKEGYTVF
jgi:hypothetical protein